MEDVKTFLRLLIKITIASIIISKIYITNRPRDHFIKDLLGISIKSTKECYKKKIFIHTIGGCAIALLIPLHKFIIYPAIQRCIPSIKIYQKFLLGMAIKVISIILPLVFDMSARRVNLKSHGNVSHCIFIQINMHYVLMLTALDGHYTGSRLTLADFALHKRF